MKKYMVLILLSCIIGFSSTAGAYSYSFDFQSGAVSLHVAENCSLLSLVTVEDMVVDMEFDLPPAGQTMEYTASLDVTLGLSLGPFGSLPINLNLEDLSLGQFSSMDPTPFLGDGTSVVPYAGDAQPFVAQFGQYSLDALVDYDITITPDQTVDGRYGIHIETFTVYDGNTSELLSGIINDMNNSGQSPITLEVPFTIPMTVTGTVDIQADPVPVPAAIWLLGAGLTGLAGIRKTYS